MFNQFKLKKSALAFTLISSTFVCATLSTTLFASYSATAETMDTKSPTIQLTGEMEQGGLMIGKTAASNTVKLNGKKIALSSTGDYAFGFGRDDTTKYTLSITTPEGKTVKQEFSPKKRQYNEQSITGIAQSIMKPNPVAVERSRKDSRQISAARQISSELTAFSQGFIAPIEGIITGVYGSRRIYNGEPKRPHFGLDYAGDIGDPVKAPAAGKVLLYVADMFYSGGTMIIDHGQGVSSTFLHLSDAYVKDGDMVEQGQVVAAVGKSGRATGPHLDWRINWFNTKIDPALVLKIKPIANKVQN